MTTVAPEHSTTTSAGTGTHTGLAARIPGYVAGTWTIDADHSSVGFTVRHMMVSKVRGSFGTFSGTIVTGENPLESSASATIDLASISTGNAQRDAHIRTADFFDVDSFPHMVFRSTGLRVAGDDYLLDGELTIRGVTRPVTLTVDLGGFGPDAYGGTRVGFSARTEINRHDFGVSWNGTIEAGGVIVSDTVQISLDIEAVLDQS